MSADDGPLDHGRKIDGLTDGEPYNNSEWATEVGEWIGKVTGKFFRLALMATGAGFFFTLGAFGAYLLLFITVPGATLP